MTTSTDVERAPGCRKRRGCHVFHRAQRGEVDPETCAAWTLAPFLPVRTPSLSLSLDISFLSRGWNAEGSMDKLNVWVSEPISQNNAAQSPSWSKLTSLILSFSPLIWWKTLERGESGFLWFDDWKKQHCLPLVPKWFMERSHDSSEPDSASDLQNLKCWASQPLLFGFFLQNLFCFLLQVVHPSLSDLLVSPSGLSGVFRCSLLLPQFLKNLLSWKQKFQCSCLSCYWSPLHLLLYFHEILVAESLLI